MTKIFRTWLIPLSMVAAGTLGAMPFAWTQTPAAIAEKDAGKPKSILITIIDGEGALNDVRTRTAREPIVEVDDENHKPVAGALVLFSIDNGGSQAPFATFSGAQTLSVQTDAAGRAAGTGFRITGQRGNYRISVQASAAGLQATAVINEMNTSTGSSSSGAETSVKVISHKKLEWILGGAAAGAAIAGIVIATQGSSPTTVTPGTGTVGAPGFVRSFHFQFRPRRP
jgi:hypothetical protein